MGSNVYVLIVVAGGLALLLAGSLVMITKFYRKVDQGKALIINTMKDIRVTFSGGIVVPIIHLAEIMIISVKTIEIDRRGRDGLICKDNIRADIKVAFFVRVNKTQQDVLKVAQAIGCERASDQVTLEELFTAKFSEALKTVGKKLEFVQLYTERSHFKDQLLDTIGSDLNGYVLDDAAIDYLEQTPVDHLDKDNILDSQGIRKITEITSIQAVLTNDLRQTERKEIKRQNVDAQKVILDLEKDEKDAEAKQAREIATVLATEQAETRRVQAEQLLIAEKARISTEEELAKDEENKLREVEVARKNRERVIAIETERVEKGRQLEAVSREREVELQRIDKEKALEVEKRLIADVIRERIAVDKTVAQEEEAIKDLRVGAEANRQKTVIIVNAEAKAQESLVQEIKAAEASEVVATFKAKEKLTLAEADLAAADREAAAQIRLSEGTQAEAAAVGLGNVRVKEAEANAVEKVGLAEARVQLEKMQAEAIGREKQGFAEVNIKEADAAATEKVGLAEATVVRERLLAEATGEEKKGLAHARVKEADAAALEKRGQAEAVAIREKLNAEAAGLTEKANAMKQLDGVGKEHEEFRLRLDKEREIQLEEIRQRRAIAQAQAEVLGKAFQQAKFNIVGGDGAFFERFVNAVSLGQSIDGFVDNSDTTRTVLAEYLEGGGSLPTDLKDVLSRPALSADAVQSLTLSAVLGRFLTSAPDAETKTKLERLISAAAELGVDKLAGK